MTDKNMKPCPFCGSAPYYTESVNGTSMAYAGCATCGIAFKASLVPTSPGCFDWSKNVLAAWNQRADLRDGLGLADAAIGNASVDRENRLMPKEGIKAPPSQPKRHS